MGEVGNVDEIEKLRGDLKKLGAWSKEWQMVFNADNSMQTSVRYYILIITMSKFIMLWMVIFFNLLRKNGI